MYRSIESGIRIKGLIKNHFIFRFSNEIEIEFFKYFTRYHHVCIYHFHLCMLSVCMHSVLSSSILLWVRVCVRASLSHRLSQPYFRRHQSKRNEMFDPIWLWSTQRTWNKECIHTLTEGGEFNCVLAKRVIDCIYNHMHLHKLIRVHTFCTHAPSFPCAQCWDLTMCESEMTFIIIIFFFSNLYFNPAFPTSGNVKYFMFEWRKRKNEPVVWFYLIGISF